MWTTTKFRFLLLLPAIFQYGCQQPKSETPTSGSLHVIASESHRFIAAKEADVFKSLYTEAKISVSGATSRECFVHLINDSVRLVVADRQMNDEERRIAHQEKMEIEEVKVAIDALALLVHKLNAMQSISWRSFREIVDKKITNWNQIPESKLTGPLQFVTSGKNSGSYELLKYHFLKLEQDFMPSMILESQSQVLKYVAKNPQAIGLVSLACYKDDSSKAFTMGSDAEVRALAFANVDSAGTPVLYKLHQYNVYHKLYPMYYPIYLYFNKKSTLAAGFCAFIASAPGQKIITEIGLVPATMPVRFVQLK